MSALPWPFESRVARGFIVAALLFGLTFGGAPLGATCCGLGANCRCAADTTAESSATAPVSNKTCPCCSSHAGRCQRCCLHRQAMNAAAKSSRHPVSVAALQSAESAAATCCRKTPVRSKSSPSEGCRCARRADLDVPRHVSPLRAPITERVVENDCDRFLIDQLATGQFAQNRIQAPARSNHVERVITLCCLVI
jgi:hypothetical protein